ncbi:TPA: hypothetical protein ACGSTL_001392 [Vibrio parahaemolyticus]|uniref:hypothetical protein n=1 Tax=Vibrio campbellii TaxID=680 RepID=UPI001F085D50|nr:hypothetical protein [Vibrio campbellii]UMM06837.1 hypothetical protein MKR81_26615 [Vibrio campbellii]
MPNKDFDHIEIQSAERFNTHCHCGNEVRSIDGDFANVDIGHPVRGVGWMIWAWDCPDCGKVFSLSLGVVSNPVDDIIAIDNYQVANSCRMVLLEKDGVKVFGIEQFDVQHENPEADFALRHYDCMAEYNIGPMKDKKMLYEKTLTVASALINRVQIEFPKLKQADDH